jgi:hypothetical protein
MAEFVLRYFKTQGPQGGFERNPAKSKDRAHIAHFRQRGGKKPAASRHLVRQGLILWRDATHSIGDPAADENQAIVNSLIVAAAGKPEIKKCFVEKNARVIAREGTAGPVRTFQTGGKPNY